MKNKDKIPTPKELIALNEADLRKNAETILLAKNAGVSQKTLDKMIESFSIRKKYHDISRERLKGVIENGK